MTYQGHVIGMMDKEAFESKLSPMLRKIFALLAESNDSRQAAVFHNHIKQTLVDWETTQTKTIDTFAGSIHLLLDAFVSRMPPESAGISHLKLIQTCLTPPLSDAELTLLWQNVEQAAKILKRSPDFSIDEMNKAKRAVDKLEISNETHHPKSTAKESSGLSQSPLSQLPESQSNVANMEFAENTIPTIDDEINPDLEFNLDFDMAQTVEKNFIKPKLVERVQLDAEAMLDQQLQDCVNSEESIHRQDIMENIKTAGLSLGNEGVDTKPLKAPKAVLKMIRFPENSEQDSNEPGELKSIEELAAELREFNNLIEEDESTEVKSNFQSKVKQKVRSKMKDERDDIPHAIGKDEMDKLHNSFVKQMQTIVAESAEFGVHLGLEIDALDEATNINQIEERRKMILASMKKISESHTDLAKKIDTAQAYLSIVESDKRKLGDELERVRTLSLTDELTSLPNRRAFLRRMDDEVSRVKRYGFSLSLVLIDIDHFKQVNDKYGHAAGDAVLQVYAEKILPIFRHHDMVARYGGEEFAVLLPNTDLDGVLRALDKVKSSIPKIQCNFSNFSIPAPTFSAGVTEYRAPESTSQFIGRADRALYRAKHLGRNRIEVEQTSREYAPIDQS